MISSNRICIPLFKKWSKSRGALGDQQCGAEHRDQREHYELIDSAVSHGDQAGGRAL